MNRRVVINLVTFVVLFLVLSLWAVTNIVSFDFIERPFTVTAEFKTSPGLQPNFEVTYLGHAIGKIGPVALAGDHVTAKLKINRGTRIPGGLNASVRRKSAVGEPYVELQALPDQRGFPDHLEDGADIPVERTSTPLAYSDLFAALDQLVAAVPGDDLHTLVHELAVGVEGRADDFRTIVQSTTDATTTFAQHSDVLDQLIGDLTKLTGTLALHREAIGSSVDNLAAIAETLAANRASVHALVGQTFTTRLAQLLDSTQDDVNCLVDALDVVVGGLNTPEHRADLERLLIAAPRAAAALRDIYVNPGEDGADGPFLDGTFLVNDGSQALPSYDPRPSLPVPQAVPDCAATHAPVTGAGPSSGVGAGGQTKPKATTSEVDVPDRVIPKPTSPATSDRDLGPDSPLAGIVDLAVGLLPLLLLLALIALVAVTKPWTRLGGGKKPGAKTTSAAAIEPAPDNEEDALTP